ncbi:helix-turn-helix domain-containing protein [Paenibacillus koleovorans]|uniref:helix-turn-helix domain-containing protein n=1 Tax=Paenibacillus koleovorans TaxID=121608 RepID=UPI0013E28EF2|nr:helix-turn-helix domain-containing protein [Paenibacillus koleovorans]
MDAVETLTNYHLQNKLTDEFMIYLRGSQYIYGSGGSYPLPALINSIYKGSWDKELFINNINNINESTVYSSNETNTRQIISIFKPIPQISSKPYATAIFIISKNNIKELLSSRNVNSSENILLFDPNNNLVFSLKNEAYLSSDKLSEYLDNSKEGKTVTEVLLFDHVNYFLSTAHSSETGWTYVRIVTEEEALNKLFNIKQLYLLTFIILMLVGAALILIAILNNYNPIKKLMSFAIRISKTKESDKGSLKDSVNSIVKSYGDMESSLKNNQFAIKEYMLSLLLNGQLEQIEKINATNSSNLVFKIEFTRPTYFSCIINLGTVHATEKFDNTKFVEFIEQMLSPELEGYCRIILANTSAVLLLSTEYADKNLVSSKISMLSDAIQKKFSINPCFGIGGFYTSISDFWKSYLEAGSALDYKILKKQDKIIFFSDLPNKDIIENPNFPKEKLEHLENYILQMNLTKVEESLLDILNDIQQDGVSLNHAKCIYYDVINIVIKSIQELDIPTAESASLNEEIYELANIETVEALFDSIMELIARVQHIFISDLQSSNNHYIHDVVGYIREHFHEYDFSISSLSEKFNISEVYLRKLFKNRHGVTLQEYVTSLKIEKAQELLIRTELSLKEIVQQIGYVDTASFSRKFRLQVGMTPGEYRRGYR